MDDILSQVRGRLTYANVVSSIALFLALAGTSYAAITITGRNVKDGSLTGRDVKNSSLSGADVKNRSLTSGDFKTGQLPRGAAGARGAAGTPGPTGATGASGATGPSTGYVKGGGNVLGVGTATVTAVSMAVPAGAYVASARVNVYGGVDPHNLVQCTLTVGTVADSAEDNISPLGNDANDYNDAVPLTGAGTLAAPGTISVTCRVANNGQGFNISSSRLTAVKVDALAP